MIARSRRRVHDNGITSSAVTPRASVAVVEIRRYGAAPLGPVPPRRWLLVSGRLVVIVTRSGHCRGPARDRLGMLIGARVGIDGRMAGVVVVVGAALASAERRGRHDVDGTRGVS
jgi:hypothetical protein